MESICQLLGLLLTLEEAHTEYALLKFCFAFLKFAFSLRTTDTSFNKCVQEEFDVEIRRAPGGILGTPLLANQWMQASLPISKGRMGLRSTRNHGLEAHLAYLGHSQPLVAEMRGGIVDDKQSMAQEEGVSE